MKYQLIRLQEHLVFIGQPPKLNEQKEFNINWSFDLDFDRPKDNLLRVRIEAQINVEVPKGHQPIGQFEATHTFSVGNMQIDFTQANTDNELFNFLATLAGISLGSMRGLAYARTVNILGPGVLMPVVNPSDLLKRKLGNIIQKMEQRQAKA